MGEVKEQDLSFLDQPDQHVIPPQDNHRTFYRRISMGGSRLSRTNTRLSATGTIIDNRDFLTLPTRILSENANLDEYTEETAHGEILRTHTTAQGRVGKWELVTFTVKDPASPKNWSKPFKWWCTMTVAFVCFTVAFNSAVITADISGMAEEFHVSNEIALLSITLFVIGFGVGPMVFAPLSEAVGRKPIYVCTLAVAVVFIVPGAVAKNITTLLVARAIDGIAFSAPMTLVGGTLADLWHNNERGVPMAAFSAAPFIGPMLGPLIGGFLSDSLGWRWLYWIQLILSGFAFLMLAVTVPETYAPAILARRAKKMRKDKGDDRYVTEADIEVRPLSERVWLFLVRPFQLLFGEAIVFFVSVYMSVLYGLLYMFFLAFPIVFEEGKGYNAGQTGLMFIPMAIGVICAACVAPTVNRHYMTLVKQYNGHPPPEVRLIPMMLCCWFIPVGLFIFAWTSYPRLSWWGPAVGAFPVGFGFLMAYNSANSYIIDSYQHQAASALAAKTFLRSIWGACTVLFTGQMYACLGNQWASSLLGFIGLACCGIPYVFYWKGAAIREHSKFAYADDEEKPAEEFAH